MYKHNVESLLIRQIKSPAFPVTWLTQIFGADPIFLKHIGKTKSWIIQINECAKKNMLQW